MRYKTQLNEASPPSRRLPTLVACLRFCKRQQLAGPLSDFDVSTRHVSETLKTTREVADYQSPCCLWHIIVTTKVSTYRAEFCHEQSGEAGRGGEVLVGHGRDGRILVYLPQFSNG